MARKSKLDQKLLLIPIGIILVGVIVKEIVGSINRITYSDQFKAEIPRIATENEITMKDLKVFLDFSGSMRGFVDFAGMPVGVKNTLNSTVTMFLDNVEAEYGVRTQAFCGNYQYDKDALRDALQSKSIFNDGTTLLHKMIEKNTPLADETTVVAIVSDMVLSFGKSKVVNSLDTFYNRTQLDNLAMYVHDAMTDARRSGMDVAFLQYYSDYNGKYYCNFTENIKKGAAYKGQLMKDRPFYIMLIGKDESLKSILSKECLPEYNNIYTTFSIEGTDYKDIGFDISEFQTRFWIRGSDPTSKKAGFTTTTDRKDNTACFNIDCKGFKIPGYLNNNPMTLNLIGCANFGTVSGIKYDGNKSTLSFQYTTLPYSALDKETDVMIEIFDSCADWKAQANMDDDIDKSPDYLKGKTWGIQTLMETISKAYRDQMPSMDAKVGVFSFSLGKSN